MIRLANSPQLVHFVICVDADQSKLTTIIQPLIESDLSDQGRRFVESLTHINFLTTLIVHKYIGNLSEMRNFLWQSNLECFMNWNHELILRNRDCLSNNSLSNQGNQLIRMYQLPSRSMKRTSPPVPTPSPWATPLSSTTGPVIAFLFHPGG